MIRTNIAIISSRSEKPLSVLDFGFWILDFRFWILGRSMGSSAPRSRESPIPDPKSQIELPVTILLSIQPLFVRCGPDIKYIDVIPVFRILFLIRRSELPI